MKALFDSYLFAKGALEGYDIFFTHSRHVETVVLLFHKTPDSHINIKVEFGEGEGKILLDKIAERAEAYKPPRKGYLQNDKSTALKYIPLTLQR